MSVLFKDWIVGSLMPTMFAGWPSEPAKSNVVATIEPTLGVRLQHYENRAQRRRREAIDSRDRRRK